MSEEYSNELRDLTQFEVSVVCLIIQAFMVLHKNDSTKFYSIDEFCDRLNMYSFNDIDVNLIKDLIPKIAFIGSLNVIFLQNLE